MRIFLLGSGRVVSASGSETSVLSLTPTSAIIYVAYTSIKKKINFQINLILHQRKNFACVIIRIRFSSLLDFKASIEPFDTTRSAS